MKYSANRTIVTIEGDSYKLKDELLTDKLFNSEEDALMYCYFESELPSNETPTILEVSNN